MAICSPLNFATTIGPVGMRVTATGASLFDALLIFIKQGSSILFAAFLEQGLVPILVIKGHSSWQPSFLSIFSTS